MGVEGHYIMRDGFTVHVSPGERVYASERFYIFLELGTWGLTGLEKDLLRWAFAGKSLPFEVGEDDFIYYYGDLKKLVIKEGGKRKTFKRVEINGEEFCVVKNHVENNYVIPGEVPVYLTVDDETGRVHVFKASGDGFTLVGHNDKNGGVPGFIMEFIRERRAEVLKKYVPMGDGLEVGINVWNGDVLMKFYFGEQNMTGLVDLVVRGDEDVARGYGVFRNGFVSLEVPLDELAGLKENFMFGFVPEKYVDKWILRYPALKRDVSVEVRTPGLRHGEDFYLCIEYGRGLVCFEGNGSCISVYNGKKKRGKSKRVFVKYLKEAGMVE